MSRTDATISVGADGSAFSKAMQSMAKDTDTMANSISARLARLGQAIQGLASVGNITSGVLAAFTAPAAEVENTAAAIAVMTGNMSDAEHLAVRLQLMAANGVRGMDELQRAARALTNVWQDSGNIEHWVGVLADIAAGSKVPADRLAEMVARFKDMGKAEFTELANAGVPIFEALAKATGKSRDEVVRLQAVAGGISFDELMAALQSLTEEGARYHKMNATMSNTTSGSFDTLKASIEACAAVLGKPINDTLRPILQDLSTHLQEMRPQMEQVAAAFGNFLRGAAQVAAPVIDALAHIAGLFTSTERVVSYAAAALLVYAANANRAAAATFNFGNVVGAAAVRLKAFNLRGVFTSWAGAIGGAKRLWAGFTGFVAVSWKSMCISLGVAFKAAMVAVKAALISTGIGAVIWALGEGIAAVYRYFAGADDAAAAANASVRQFDRTLRGLKKQAKDVRTEMDMANVLERAKEQAEDLRDAEAAARDEGDDEAAERARRQRAALYDWMRTARAQMELTVEQAQAEERRTRQMAEQARLAEEARRAEEARLRTIEQMRKAREAQDFEKEMEIARDMPEGLGGGTERVIWERLRRINAASEEALYAERARLEGLYNPTEQQLERYKAVADAIAKIEQEHQKAEDAARARRDENATRRENYMDRRRTWEDGREQAAYERKSIPAQEKALQKDARLAGYWGALDPDAIRAHLDELAESGAKSNEREIAALERILDLHAELVERKKQLAAATRADKQEMRIQALELSGRQRAADALREEVELEKRVAELRGRGMTKKEATRQATMEGKIRQAQTYQERMQASRVEYLQSGLASVGGGGASIRLGDSQLSEAKKHSKLLKEIRDFVRPRKGENVAVLA